MTETDKPRAKGDMKCPLWQKPMKTVCHTCEWWIHLRGKHPQGEEVLDQWGCAIAWMPMLMVENSQMQRQTGASVDKVASVMYQAAVDATALRADAVGSILKQLNNGEQQVERLTDASYNRRP
jgi:hypothetical protein